jgi:glycosyltransferase 2 family protein
VKQTATAWQLAPWISGLFLLAVLILVVLRVGELERFAELVRGARPGWLLVALALQLATYACTASVWRSALAAAGAPHTLKSLVPLSLAKVFTDQLLPSGGLSGTVLLVHGLERRGIDATIAGQTLLVALVSFYSAYVIAALGAAAVLWLHDELNTVLAASAGVFLAMGVGTLVAVALLRKRGTPPGWLNRLPGIAKLFQQVAAAPATLLRDKRVVAVTLALQLAVFALDALTFSAVFLSLARPVTLATAFTTFMSASVAATIGPIPLGLGTFEGASVALLHVQGVEVEAALAATLLLRGLTFWLPMLPGLWLARRELAGDGYSPAARTARIR